MMNKKAIAHIQIDNPRTRVTEWRFAPGAETGEHLHPMDYVVVPQTTGSLKIIDATGQEVDVQLTAGQAYFRNRGVHHNVINTNDFEFCFIEIEFRAL